MLTLDKILAENDKTDGHCFNTARITPVPDYADDGDDDDPCNMRSCLAYLDCQDCTAEPGPPGPS